MEKFCNVLYFKHVIENSLNSFFRDNEERFSYDRNSGTIVFSGGFSKAGMKKILRKSMVEEIRSMTRPYDPMNRKIYFMLGSCPPSENFLLKYIDFSRYFPEKVKRYIDSGTIKYFLKVEDVRIDLSLFNSIFEEIFDEFFSRRNFKKYFPENEKNLFFLKKSNIDCYVMYRIIKKHFGRINVCNMREENMGKLKSNLYSVNNRIDDYVTGVKKIIEEDEFLRIPKQEIEQYLDFCIGKEV